MLIYSATNGIANLAHPPPRPALQPALMQSRALVEMLSLSNATAAELRTPASIQSRMKTLLRFPSRAALHDVLDGPYYPDARPGYQRALISVTLLTVTTACVVGTAARLVWPLTERLHSLWISLLPIGFFRYLDFKTICAAMPDVALAMVSLRVLACLCISALSAYLMGILPVIFAWYTATWRYMPTALRDIAEIALSWLWVFTDD